MISFELRQAIKQARDAQRRAELKRLEAMAQANVARNGTRGVPRYETEEARLEARRQTLRRSTERLRQLYQSDPEYRARKLEQVRAYKQRVKLRRVA